MAASGSYARGEQPRSVHDPLAEPYERMVAQQRRYNARHASDPLAELRREQAEFRKARDAAANENAWMAVPALGPAAVVLALEAPLVLAGRTATAVQNLNPQLFKPFTQVGETWATRMGRRAHKVLEERIAGKGGWSYNQRLPDSPLRPDVRTPPRVRKAGEEPKHYYLELKPNTPRGRRAGRSQVKKYEAIKGVKARAIYYDPKSVQ